MRIMFARRLGENSKLQCVYGHHCPQFLEMENGDIAVVGTDITIEAADKLPPGPGVGPGERIVRVPRRIFVAAGAEIRSAA